MTAYAGLVLAAGLGSRFKAAGGAGPTKLVATIDGRPLVRRVVEIAQAGGLAPVVVVTGYAREAVSNALQACDVITIHNPDYAHGLSTSLKAGVAALPATCSGVVILLGDMPTVAPAVIVALVAAAEARPDAQAVVPTYDGQRGNPVLIRRALFEAIGRLQGDAGARALLRDPAITVVDVPTADAGVRLDIDAPADIPQSTASR